MADCQLCGGAPDWAVVNVLPPRKTRRYQVPRWQRQGRSYCTACMVLAIERYQAQGQETEA